MKSFAARKAGPGPVKVLSVHVEVIAPPKADKLHGMYGGRIAELNPKPQWTILKGSTVLGGDLQRASLCRPCAMWANDGECAELGEENSTQSRTNAAPTLRTACCSPCYGP